MDEYKLTPVEIMRSTRYLSTAPRQRPSSPLAAQAQLATDPRRVLEISAIAVVPE